MASVPTLSAPAKLTLTPSAKAGGALDARNDGAFDGAFASALGRVSEPSRKAAEISISAHRNTDSRAGAREISTTNTPARSVLKTDQRAENDTPSRSPDTGSTASDAGDKIETSDTVLMDAGETNEGQTNESQANESQANVGLTEVSLPAQPNLVSPPVVVQPAAARPTQDGLDITASPALVRAPDNSNPIIGNPGDTSPASDAPAAGDDLKAAIAVAPQTATETPTPVIPASAVAGTKAAETLASIAATLSGEAGAKPDQASSDKTISGKTGSEKTGSGDTPLLPSWLPPEGASARIKASRSANSVAPGALLHPDLATFQSAAAEASVETDAPAGAASGKAAQEIASEAATLKLASSPLSTLTGSAPSGLLPDATQDASTLPAGLSSAAPLVSTDLTSGIAAAIHTGSALAHSAVETTALLAAQIARRLDARSTRFDMALTPDDLGRVDVSLDIDADGSLTARLAFDNPLAATELRGRAEELRRQLQEAGFTVGADALSFSERDSGGSRGGAERQFGQNSGQAASRAFAGASQLNLDAEVAGLSPVWASHSQTPQGVDLKV